MAADLKIAIVPISEVPALRQGIDIKGPETSKGGDAPKVAVSLTKSLESPAGSKANGKARAKRRLSSRRRK